MSLNQESGPLGERRLRHRLLETGAAASAGAATVGPTVLPAAGVIQGHQAVVEIPVEEGVVQVEVVEIPVEEGVVGVEEGVGRLRVIPTTGAGGAAGRAVIRVAAAMLP